MQMKLTVTRVPGGKGSGEGSVPFIKRPDVRPTLYIRTFGKIVMLSMAH